MSDDPRAALDRMIAALEAHLVAVQQRRGEQDPAVEHAYAVLSDAYETYDEALFDTYGETTPFELYDEDDDDLDDEDEDAGDDDIDETDLGPDDEDDEIEVDEDQPNPATRL